MTRLKHYDDLGTARFVTFSCYYRRPSLNHPGAKEIVAEELDRARAKHGFRLLGYVKGCVRSLLLMKKKIPSPYSSPLGGEGRLKIPPEAGVRGHFKMCQDFGDPSGRS